MQIWLFILYTYFFCGEYDLANVTADHQGLFSEIIGHESSQMFFSNTIFSQNQLCCNNRKRQSCLVGDGSHLSRRVHSSFAIEQKCTEGEFKKTNKNLQTP